MEQKINSKQKLIFKKKHFGVCVFVFESYPNFFFGPKPANELAKNHVGEGKESDYLWSFWISTIYKVSPLQVISGIITPISRIITPVTQL